MNTNTKKTKGFFFQILVELKVLLSSKFNIIVAAIIILGSIAVPVVGQNTVRKRIPDRITGTETWKT